MLIEVKRLQDNGKSTIGTMSIDKEFEAFTLEDTFNEPKIQNETRIPDGVYRIKLRNEGGMTKKYSAKYGDEHEGMLHLQDVPNFTYVYIHTGNNHEHTDGCILVGTACNSNKNRQTVTGSVLKYKKTYAKILKAIKNGEEVTIKII